MKISSLDREFKQYALLGKGMTNGVYRSIGYTLQMLRRYASTETISSLTPDTIRAFLYSGRSERGWAPKTYRNHWQYLKIYFDFCRRQGYVRSNPVEGIEKPKLPERLPRCLSHEDSLIVLAYSYGYEWRYHLEATRNHAIIATLMMTGLRLQELLNLEVQDVDLSGCGILVRRGKGHKDRLVPIHHRLLPILRGYAETRRQSGRISRWLFTGVKSDKQLAQKDVRRICKKISVACGVKFTPHILRHTLGRELVDKGVDIKTVQRIFGHAQVTTTEIYTHLSTRAFKENFQKAKIF